MRAEGSNGSVELLDDSIVIRRKGLANILTQGLHGEKTIPFSNITAVEFKAAGTWMAGMIQFTLVGGREFRGGLAEATRDENAVLFTKAQQAAFEAVRDTVRKNVTGNDGALSQSSVADELTQLAALVDRGFVSREEFDERKRTLLRL